MAEAFGLFIVGMIWFMLGLFFLAIFCAVVLGLASVLMLIVRLFIPKQNV